MNLAIFCKHNTNIHVEIWGLSREGRCFDLCQEHGIPCRTFPFYWRTDKFKYFLRTFLRAIRFVWRLRKSRPFALISYCLKPNVLCGISWRFTGAKTCIWSQRDLGTYRLPRFLEKAAIRSVPCFVSNSKHGISYLRDELKAPEKKVHFVHNGIRLEPPQQDRITWRASLSIPPNTFLACMVANIHSNKDHVTLIKAWNLVCKDMNSTDPPPILLLAGYLSEPTASELNCLITQLQIQDSVRFLGQVDDVSGLLQTVDIGVFSSRKEGFPNGLLESLASGLPVIATDIPGIREAVGSNNRWCLAPPGDISKFALIILKLFRDPHLRKEIGLMNQMRVRDFFSVEKMGQGTIEIMNRSALPEHTES